MKHTDETLYKNFIARHELKEVQGDALLRKYGLLRPDYSGLSVYRNWDHVKVFKWIYASRGEPGHCVVSQPYGVNRDDLERLVSETTLTAFVFEKALRLSWHNPTGTDLIVLANLKMSGVSLYNSLAARPCSWTMFPAARVIEGSASTDAAAEHSVH